MQTAAESIVAKNLADPLWRLNNLYRIIDKHGENVPFRLNEAQQKLVDNLMGRDIILKARQMGFTTLMCIIALDECLFNKNWRAAVIAHKLEDAKTIFETKVKFPYEQLPEGIRNITRSIKDSADSLQFSNGSLISVTTSARSGTLQRLHVSEFGKTCAMSPAKAREIVTGSFPAVEHGSITIESTAEGQEGRFYEMTMDAMPRTEWGPKDWKFHFFPWWSFEEYQFDVAVRIPPETRRYFDTLEHNEGIKLTDAQKAWWIATERELGGDMKREYPATPQEAFEQAIEGAYFEQQLAHSRKVGNIGRFPFDPRFEVNSFWDLGRNDSTSIWLHQRVGERNRFIGYYENSGEHISHYTQWLRAWRESHRAAKGQDYVPHDGNRDDLFLKDGRIAEFEKLGVFPIVVPRVNNKGEAINAARALFPSCDFDETECALGLKHLGHYRKEWDEARGVWKDRPRHDAHSHGADAFMTFATGYDVPPEYDDFQEPTFLGRSETTGY
jgi:hypothetical protein